MTADRAPELRRDSGVPQTVERGFESVGDLLKAPLALSITSTSTLAGLYDGIKIGLNVIGPLAERPVLTSAGNIDGQVIIGIGVVLISGSVYLTAGFVASFRVVDRFMLPSAQRRFS